MENLVRFEESLELRWQFLSKGSFLALRTYCVILGHDRGGTGTREPPALSATFL